MTTIDWAKPVIVTWKKNEYAPAVAVRQRDGDYRVHGFYFRPEGIHRYRPSEVTVRQEGAALALDTGKPLQTVDGKRVSFVGKLEDGRIVVQVTYPGSWNPGSAATELRFADGRKSSRPGETSGDDVIVKITEKVVFQNVYADGTTGATQHASADEAAKRSKYGKVRIGILKTTYRDGVRFSAVITPATVPWYRDASVSSGRAATPEEFAR